MCFKLLDTYRINTIYSPFSLSGLPEIEKIVNAVMESVLNTNEWIPDVYQVHSTCLHHTKKNDSWYIIEAMMLNCTSNSF